MSKQKGCRMRKVLSIVTGISFIEKVRQRTLSDDVIHKEHSDADLTLESHGINRHVHRSRSETITNSSAEKCPSCEVTNCRHDVTLEYVPVGVTDRDRWVSVQSSVFTPGEVIRGSVHESQFLKDEKTDCNDAVELTDDQKGELRQAFSMFEKAGKGRIPARDLGELLRCLGWNPSEQDLEEARHELELTTRGSLSFAEVEGYIARRGGIYYGNNTEEDIMVAFQVLDKNGTGRITVSDFRHFLTTMGERMSQEEAGELIARSTQDGRDYIEYRDLVLAVQQLPT